MAVFSRRQPRGRQRDEFTDDARQRLLLVIGDTFKGKNAAHGRPGGDYFIDFFEDMHGRLKHVVGRVQLSAQPTTSPAQDAFAFVHNCSTEHFFDFLELTFKSPYLPYVCDPGDIVDMINHAFRLAGTPYQVTPFVEHYEPLGGGGTRITVASYPQVINAEQDVTYTEAVAPALAVLGAPEYSSANSEFLGALEDYRRGDYGDCLTKCASAFESTMKVLCGRNQWAPAGDTVQPLVHEIVSKSTLDGFFEQPLVLIATIRNRLSSSHGGGSTPRTVEAHIAQYAVTATAAAILLLIGEAG